MSRPLNDTELALAQAKHMANTMDLLMGAMSKASGVTDRPIPPPDSALHWTEYDLEYGWTLHLGYSSAGDPDDDGDISISRVILNTGQREVTLTAADLDSATWFGCEEACREDWRKSCEVQP